MSDEELDRDNSDQYDTIVKQSYNIVLKQINDSDLHRPKNMTDEEEERDRKISRLLEHYVNNYREKIKFNQKYKLIIIWFCFSVVILFLAGIVALMILAGAHNNIGIESVVGIVASIISFVGLFIGVLKIITEYVFPKDEEQYITKIVEDIQKNDLANKRTDMEFMRNDNESEK